MKLPSLMEACNSRGASTKLFYVWFGFLLLPFIEIPSLLYLLFRHDNVLVAPQVLEVCSIDDGHLSIGWDITPSAILQYIMIIILA